MKSAVIIGGGPAGCQCALWLKMMGHDVIIIEESATLGGLQALSPYLNNWMAGMINIPGQAFAKLIQEHIHYMNIPVIFKSTLSSIKRISQGFTVKIDDDYLDTYRLVIATGVRPRHENIAKAENIFIGPSQAVYEYNFTHKRVAILGGGDNAAEHYAFIIKSNPSVCHLYTRTIKARKNLWQHINLKDVYFSPYHMNEHDKIINHQGIDREYDVILVMYGWEANYPSILEDEKPILLNEKGFIKTDKFCHTPVTHIYAIGEVANRSHPCVTTSMADGVIAAKAIQEELE